MNMNVFVCSNPRCLAVWDTDPHGHCPSCITATGVGYSCITCKVEPLNTERRDKIYATLRRDTIAKIGGGL